MKLHKRYSNQRGASLLEVLISFIILGFALLSLAPTLVLSVRANGDSRDRTVAMQLAKERLEDLEDSDTLDDLPATDEELDLKEKFTRTTVIADHDIDSLIPENRYRVTVVVSWQSMNDDTYSTELSTLIWKE